MAFIRNTDKLIEGSSKLFFSNVRAKAAVQSDLDSLSAGISSEQSARQSEDSGIKLRLDVIEGGAGVSGSIAKAQADAQAYADQKVAALVNSAPAVLDTLKELSDAIGGDASFATTIAGQIGAVDDKVDQEVLDRQAAISLLQSSFNSDVSDLESAIDAEESRAMLAEGALDTRLDVLEADPVTKSYVDGEILSVEGQVSSEQSRAEAAEGLLDGRLDILEGADNVVGSVAKALKDAKAYTDSEVSLEASARSSAISSEQSARESADSALDVRLDVLEQDPTTKSYVDGIQSALDARLDIIEGVDSVEGSVAKAEKDAKDYADSLNSAMDLRVDVLEQDPTTKSYVDGIQSALDSRLDLLEADPVSKTYVDGEVSDLQGQITQEISDRQSAISSVEGLVDAEEVRALAAEGLLDGRLDILEQDPTTKSYVDSEVASEESRAMSAESALSGRLDALELDPVSKTYVDGEVSDLQSQVTTEKGRIDAILSASEADKDSFAEIVSLINSVDTTNDSAFAGYVLSNDAALAQEISDRQSGDSALDARLDIIEGLDSVEGSVAKAEKDAKDYADAAVLVEKNRAEAAEGLLDGRLDVLESDPTTKAYVDGEISSVESRLDVIEGAGEGSVAKAEQDAKDYANSLNSAMDARVDVLETDPTTKTYVDSQVSAEASARSAEDLTMLKLDGSRAMTGVAKIIDGTVTNPGLRFNSQSGAGYGMFLSGTSFIGITFNSSTKLQVTASGVAMNGSQTMTAASNANLIWSTDGAGNIGGSTTNRPDFIYARSGMIAGTVVRAGDGSTSAPSFGFSSAGGTNFGMYYASSGHLAFSAGNSMAMRLGSSGNLNTSYRNMQVPDGASNAPGLCFNTDYSSGFFYSGTKIQATIQGTSSLMEISSTAVAFPKNVEFSAGMKVGLSEKSANYTITTSDYFIGVTSVTGGKVMTLPTASGNSGRVFIIKDQSGSASGTDYIRIAPQAGQTIDGQSNYEITVPYESVSVVSNGSNWFIM